MKFLNEKTLKLLRKNYPRGARVELVKMNGEAKNLPIGTRGNVICVDSVGTIHVKWDNGSGLGVAYGEDECKRV